MRKMNSRKILSFGSLLLSLTLLACAEDSAHLSKAAELNSKGGKPHDKKPEEKVAGHSPFVITKLNTADQKDYGKFLEGKEGQILLHIEPKSASITAYDVEITNAPIADQVPSIARTEQANVYALRWTPPTNLIPTNEKTRQFEITVKATPSASSNASDYLKMLATEAKVTVVVYRDSPPPTLKIVTKLTSPIQDGETVPFIVDVTDSDSERIQSTPDIASVAINHSNTEAFRANGARYFDKDTSVANNPESLGKGKWRFHYLIKVTELPLDQDRVGKPIKDSTITTVCFNLIAISVLKVNSNQELVCFKGKQKPKPAPTPKAKRG